MKSFSQGNTAFRYLKVPTVGGELVKRATGTADPVRADLMGEMVEWMEKRDAWKVLERVTMKDSTLTLDDLYRHWVSTPSEVHPRSGKEMEPSNDDRLEHVLASLNTALLDPLVTEFETALTNGVRAGAKKKVAAGTVVNYLCGVRLLVPKGSALTAAALTPTMLSQFVADRSEASASQSTARMRGMGVRQFVSWLHAKGVLGYNPMADVDLPSAGDPLCHYVEVNEAIALADAQDKAHRLYSATLGSTGIETSVALRIRRRDISVDEQTIVAPGTKNYNRRRVARVATWGWDYILEAMKGKHPDSLIHDGVTSRSHYDRHKAARTSLIALGYRIFAECHGKPKLYTERDQRHTWAVYAVRGGWPIPAVSKQLGHKNGVLAMTTYGQFVPGDEERSRWELGAATAATARMKSNEVIPIGRKTG